MDLRELYIETKNIWDKHDRAAMRAFLKANYNSFWLRSNELATCLCLSHNLSNSSANGLLFSGNSLEDSLANVKILRRAVQRLEWCNECTSDEVTKTAVSLGAEPEDLLWMIQSASVDKDRVLNRINGIDAFREDIPQKDFFSNKEYKPTEIAFIICSNNQAEFSETEYYINRLYIPNNCSVNILEVTDAKSMCSGYNDAMSASDAKYKIYLHHDVRIIDRYFLYYLLEIFNSDSDIGLIGMVGTSRFADDGYVWHECLYGSWIEGKVDSTTMYRTFDDRLLYQELLADGFLLATQYDIPWREDLFDSWHFYDASQCMEMIKQGHKIIIPYQQHAWCLHECGWSDVTDYMKYSNIFRNEYSDYLI